MEHTADIGAHSAEYLNRLKRALDSVDKERISRFIRVVSRVIGTDRTLFIAGNGGSAATSSHMACDFGKTIFTSGAVAEGQRLRVISLNDSIPLMTAWSNDASYDRIFAEQLRSLGRKGDVLVIITGSGNSGNIVEAVRMARAMDIRTFGLLGFDGGAVMPLLEDFIIVPSHDYGIVEDAHMILNHLVTDWLKVNIKTDWGGSLVHEYHESHEGVR